MTDLIFLDTETTGLDDRKHEVWDIAIAINDGPVRSYQLPHSLVTADAKALEINGYWGRLHRQGTDEYDLELKETLKDNTLVCSNPPFDRGMLKSRWMEEPWHHRSVDISSYAMPILDHGRPMGMASVASDLRRLGYTIPEPDHSAAGDVNTLRECYRALKALQSRFRPWTGIVK